MASLIKNLRLLSNISSAIRTNTSQRTLFAPAVLGIDGFKKQQEKSELLAVNNIEPFKKRLEQTLKENKPLFTEDLKTLLYLTRNDADLGLLIQALKKYKSQSLAIIDFNFGAPLMRLLYSLNKTDDALKFYDDPELQHLFDNEFTPLVILLNKLNEDKRYADTVKVFFSAIQNKKRFVDPVTKKLIVPNDAVKLVIEALYYLNDKSAIDSLKLLYKKLNESNVRLSPSSISNSILLALNQNDSDLALELLSSFQTPSGGFYHNLRAIILSKKKRFNESFAEIDKICESRSAMGTPLIVYPLTMKLVREEVEKAEDKQVKESFEAASKKVISLNRLANKDITDLTLSVINARLGPRKQDGQRQNFDGNRQQFQNRGPGSYNRQNFGDRPPRTGDGFSLNRPNFNRSRDEQGQGFSNFDRQQGTQNVGGYSRPPRTFQRDNRFEQGQQQIGNRTPNRSTKPQDDE